MTAKINSIPRVVVTLVRCEPAPIELKQLKPEEEKALALGQMLLPGNLPRELPDNFLRDFTWTAVSGPNINLAGQVMPPLDPTAPISTQLASSSFVQPMTAQWCFGTVPMVVAAACEIAYRKYKGQKVEYSKIAAPVVAASLAVPMWDTAQVIGNQLGTTSSLLPQTTWYGASIAGGLVAAPFTGMFEGFTQWAVKYGFDLATDTNMQERWKQKPSLMAKLLAKEFFLNITIGAIPGAVWQIIYFFAFAAILAALGPWGILLVALLVALGVLICNLACTHAINKVSASIDKKMGWDVELARLDQQIALERARARQMQMSAATPLKQADVQDQVA